jgi:hypothetical protein
MWCVAELTEDYIAKMEDVLEVYERPYDPEEPVVCLDENGSLTRFHFNDWPLFQELRKRPDFAAFLDTKTDAVAPVAAQTAPPAQEHQ